jgi:Zn-dependent protease
VSERDDDDVDAPATGGDRRALALLLFAATCVSTLYVGAAQVTGRDPLERVLAARSRGLGAAIAEVLPALLQGWPFAVPLMAILLCHEFAHWLAMRRHGIPSTLPLFIPFPNVFGTMGAVIAMRDGVRTRNALVDVARRGRWRGSWSRSGCSSWGSRDRPSSPSRGAPGCSSRVTRSSTSR